MRKSLLLAFALVFAATPALAAKKRGPGKPTPARTAEQCKELEGDKAEGCRVIGTYLDAWKTKKWAEVKKLTHPMTLQKIANVKKAMGEDRHSMAPWYWAKDTYLLHDWKVEKVETAQKGTVVLDVTETKYRVEEDGFDEGEAASILAGKYKGKWYVVDRRGGGGGFTRDAIEIGLKGFFDEPAKEAAAAE